MYRFNKSYIEFDFNGIHSVKENYNGKIGLMCPECLKYWIIDFHHNCNMSIDKDIFFKDKNEEYSDMKDGCDINPVRELIFSNMSKCPDCSSKNDLIMIDPNIVSIISELNKKGYRTTFSCEGHKDPDGQSLAYILFNNMSKKNQDIIEEAFSNSEYWNAYNPDGILPYYDKTEMKYYNNNFMVELKVTDKEIKDFDVIKARYLNELCYIIQNLPDLSQEEIFNNKYESTIKDYIASIEAILESFKGKINDTDIMVRLAKKVYADIFENKET